ncbi:AAA family ATPase [Pseudoalteromonas haloplanktis]|uniref:AAA family ATPase n=1 Tax=Pseudoalteromonas haloplanktis TaxID=228 RepID=A0ABU1BA83_PSEHA|nr:AAA family ATPase [Pseudoalteromonas haloplanktis]MDQ9091410.1 AAA family ATPase [Pseudoalteromonas haloplanktis]
MIDGKIDTLKLFQLLVEEKDSQQKKEMCGELQIRANTKPRLKSLTLKDYRNFKNDTLKFPNSNLIVICGVNGAGKTGLIKAIASSLSWLFNRIYHNGGRGWNGKEEDISLFNNSKFFTTSLNMDVCDRFINIEINKAFDELDKVSSHVSEATDIGNIYKYLKTSDLLVSSPLFEYYSIERNSLFKEPSQSDYTRSKEATSSFALPINLSSVMVWYKRAYDRFTGKELTSTKASLEKLVEMLFEAEDSNDIDKITREINTLKQSNETLSHEESNQIVKDVNTIASEFINGVTEVLFSYDQETKLTFNKNGKQIFFNQLSHGEQAIFALLIDIYKKLYAKNPKLPMEGTGVILIDELDLHLHPEWQRKIANYLPKIFKNCQFVIATHSAQIISEVEPSSIIVLKNDSDGTTSWHRATRSLGVSSNEVLDEIMSSETTLSMNKDSLDKYKEIEKLIEKENTSEAISLIKSLETLYGETPELIRLKFELDLLGIDFD